MKNLLKLAIALLLVLGTQSCTENEITITGLDDPSKLKISLVSPEVVTRSTGYGDDAYKESKINKATIAVFREDGSLNVIREVSFNTGTATEVTINLMSGNNQTVWAVSNINESQFSGIDNISSFETVLIGLRQESDNITMSGFTNMNIPAGDELEAEINLKRLPFKVSIPSIVKDFTKGGYPNATFDIEEVMLYSVNSKSTVTNIGSELVSGLDVEELRNHVATGFDEYTRHFFYGMPGDTRVLIGGTFKNNGVETYTYYPIDLEALNNTHYELSITITGKGVTDPDDNYDPSKLKLKLNIVDWDHVSTDHEF